MSEDEVAFIRAICQSPEDDGPRLIFADWLEENVGMIECPLCANLLERRPDMKPPGYCKCNGTRQVPNMYDQRAQFIRMQCKHSNGSEPHVVQRIGRILQLCERKVWTDMYRRVSYPTVLRIANTGESWCEFRRGFPYAIRCPFGEFKSAGGGIFRQFPIQYVEFPNHQNSAAVRYLNHLRDIRGTGESVGAGCSSPILSGLYVKEYRFRAGLEATYG